jgi:tRNA pseudouridine32 synthase/23S rRNA pseudouridine746 synthase
MSTSGIVVVANASRSSHQSESEQFTDRTIKKRYDCFLEGVSDRHPVEGKIDLPLMGDFINRPIQKVDFDQGKPAVTYYKILGTEEQISVSGKVLNPTRAYLYPVTGRTHHLRVHATHSMGVDLAMVGDDLYGKRDKRLCPHAGFLELKYPMTMRRMKFVCDVPF